jgi:uncharacterized protein
MSNEPEIPPPLSGPADEPERPWAAEPPPHSLLRRARTIPHLGHALLFLAVAGGTLAVTEIAAFALVMDMHLFGRETADRLLKEPRLLIPIMAVSYLIAGLLVWAIFTNLWRQGFAQAIRWNSSVVRSRYSLFLCVGILLSVMLQFLSGYLPIPKTLPIDDFFRTRTDVWLIAIFGTFMAPVFEELAFRGFLLPSLASAWDWMTRRNGSQETGGGGISPWTAVGTTALGTGDASDGARQHEPSSDPHWSFGALIFSSAVTSVGFALLHADQLAHSWAPLSVLFGVSIILCVIRLRFHSLAASTLVHASYNGTIFVLLFFATDGFRHLDKVN